MAFTRLNIVVYGFDFLAYLLSFFSFAAIFDQEYDELLWKHHGFRS